MGVRDGDLRRRLARAVLRLAFDPEECRAIVEDVEELTDGPQGPLRAARFWLTICSYPVAEWGARARDAMSERTREGMMGTMSEDLRFAVRGLLRRPGFALTSTTILALGIGAVVVMLSVVQGVLLDPLPMREPDRLVALWMIDAEGRQNRMTPGNVRDVAALDDVFESVTAFQPSAATLVDPAGGPTLAVRGGVVTPEYLQTIGVAPLHGRDFVAEDMDPDGPPTVLLSHSTWQRLFAGDPGVVGRTVELGTTSTLVVGVIPPGLYPTVVSTSGTLPFMDGNGDYLEVFRYAGDYWDLRMPHLLGGIARLRDGVSPETAQAALSTLSSRLSAEFEPNRGESIIMTPLRDEIVGDTGRTLVALLLAVTLVLAIAAVNVGSLFVLRSEDRAHETGLLRAIGAPSHRIARQRTLEAWLVCGGAAVAGIAAAAWLIGLSRDRVPYPVPRLESVGVEPVAIGVAALAALGLGLLFGLLPDRVHGRRSSTLGSRRTTPGRGRARLDSGLIGVQSGLAVIVIVWAILLSRSLAELRGVDPGFDASETWVFQLRGAYGATDAILEQVRAVPGVASAAVTYDHPLERSWQDSYGLVAEVYNERGDLATIRPFGEGYLETAGIELVDGRVPDALDFAGDVRMALVNESFRRRHEGEGTLLGRQVRVPSGDRRLGEGGSVFEIVGVVRDVRFLGPSGPTDPAIYLPLPHFGVGGSVLTVRPEVPTAPPLDEIRAAVAAAAPQVAIEEANGLGDLLDQELARPRFHAMLLALMSGMVLVLCSLGAYGVVSRTVVTRKREIGIRTALGAAASGITRSVMGRALKPLVVGAVVGAAFSLIGSGVLRALLFGVSPTDPVSLLAGPLLLILIGGVASLVPARRALALDPAESLRAE